jgi:hypothetical protein
MKERKHVEEGICTGAGERFVCKGGRRDIQK